MKNVPKRSEHCGSLNVTTVDLGSQRLPFWPSRKFWTSLSRHPHEWDLKIFGKYPLIIVSLAGGLPALVYLVSVVFFGLRPTGFYNYAVTIMGGIGIVTERVIKGLIEHRVRKELQATKSSVGALNPPSGGTPSP